MVDGHRIASPLVALNFGVAACFCLVGATSPRGEPGITLCTGFALQRRDYNKYAAPLPRHAMASGASGPPPLIPFL
jgi:hypothetical protein